MAADIAHIVKVASRMQMPLPKRSPRRRRTKAGNRGNKGRVGRASAKDMADRVTTRPGRLAPKVAIVPVRTAEEKMTKKFYSSEGSSGTSLLRDAHERLEAMAAAAALIKQEQWVEAERALAELQATVTELANRVRDKARDVTDTPAPDQGDRG